MALLSTTAFVLRVDVLSEKDVALTLLTRDAGVVRAALRGGRRRYRRGALVELLSEVSVTLFQKEGADLARADGLELVKSAFPLACRAETAMLLPYVAESLSTFLPEGEAAPEAYRLARHVLDALEAGAPADLAARYFEAWLLRLAGLLPGGTECASCGRDLSTGGARFDAELPGLVGNECAAPGAVPVAGAALRLLADVRRSRLGELALRQTGDEASLRALDGLLREVRRRFLGHELKSHRFLGSLDGRS
ncbi:MAG: DNA repair protein RecO [Thermoanaerobaculia bacterium]|nr:DNA repair protein RecO [Thermoanaerobaculia bacterium]